MITVSELRLKKLIEDAKAEERERIKKRIARWSPTTNSNKNKMFRIQVLELVDKSLEEQKELIINCEEDEAVGKYKWEKMKNLVKEYKRSKAEYWQNR